MCGGQRLDRWLKRKFPQLAQGRIEKLCRKGELRIDGWRCKPASRVEMGQTVRVPPLPAPGEIKAGPKPSVNEEDTTLIQSTVLYRDGSPTGFVLS